MNKFSPRIISTMYLPLIFLVYLFSTSINAQELQLATSKSFIQKYFDVAEPSLEIIPEFTYHSVLGDSLIPPPPTKPKLLPENMSLMEKVMWGESGILRSIGIAGPLTPEARKNELQTRRFMLSTHQIGGFVTLGLMIATAYYGQRVIDDGGHDINLIQTKKSLAKATIISYSLTGILSVLSPPPLIRRDDENSTISLHKTLAWIHVAGMIATPILATYIERHRTFDTDAAHVHQIAGYLTTAVFALAMIVVTF